MTKLDSDNPFIHQDDSDDDKNLLSRIWEAIRRLTERDYGSPTTSAPTGTYTQTHFPYYAGIPPEPTCYFDGETWATGEVDWECGSE